MPRKTKRTIAHLLLDMTGSMQIGKEETITSFNKYIESLREGKDTKKFVFSFSRFNAGIGTVSVASNVAPKDCPLLTHENYVPNNNTPLYDAIGHTIDAAAKEANEGDSVLIIIQTDGQENVSQEYTKEAVRKLVEEKTAAGWQFVYLACGLDAMAEAQQFGIPAGNTISYDHATVNTAMRTMTVQTLSYANCGGEASDSFSGAAAGQDYRVKK